MTFVDTGAECLNGLLGGGYENDIITTIYGPAGSGKSNICLISAIAMAKKKKVIFIDTEGGFSVERYKQLTKDDVMENIMLLKLVNFEEQKKAFEKLKKLVNDSIGMIIVDSIAMLYRLEIGKSQEAFEVNRELGRQLSYLSEIARTKKIPVIITNQVYSSFDDREAVKMVGGDILKYSSKCLVELMKYKQGKRKAILRKHRSLPEDGEIIFTITQSGLNQ